MEQGIKEIYLHKLKFNVSLVLDKGIVKTFLNSVGMWVIIHHFEEEMSYGADKERAEELY